MAAIHRMSDAELRRAVAQGTQLALAIGRDAPLIASLLFDSTHAALVELLARALGDHAEAERRARRVGAN